MVIIDAKIGESLRLPCYYNGTLIGRTWYMANLSQVYGNSKLENFNKKKVDYSDESNKI